MGLTGENYRKDITSAIYSTLLERIKDGTYSPGSKIPSENDLKEQFGVSRNTVRSAINKLNTQGFLETRRGDGTYVRQQGVDFILHTAPPIIALQKYDLLSLLEFRKGIEIEAVRLAAQRANKEDLRRLHKCLRTMHANLDNMVEFSKADTAMHYQLAVTSHNVLLHSMMDVLRYVITNDMQEFLTNQGMDIDSYFYHHSIVACIEKKKSDEAAFLMEKHIDVVISRIQKYYKNSNCSPCSEV